MTSLKEKLDHSRAAYLYAVKALPPSAPYRGNGFEFERKSQIDSMVIELGWAFFCRYEGCLEAHIKNSGITLSKKLNLLDWLKEKGAELTDNQERGLELYRTIRNKLHHEDGKSIDGDDGEEIHLLPDHMENFYHLFVWSGEFIESWNKRKSMTSFTMG